MDLTDDWGAFLTAVGVDRDNLEAPGAAGVDRSAGMSLRGSSAVTLPGLAAGDPAEVYKMDDSLHVVVPQFSAEEGLPIGEVEAFVWRGRSERGVAVLSFVNEPERGWELGAGFVNDELGTVRNIRRVDGVARLRTIAEGVSLAEVDSAAAAREMVQSIGMPAPRVVNPGSVQVDVMTVGINEPSGDRVELTDLAAMSLAGVEAFNTAMDDSSSTNWVISGVYATLRGLMIIDVATSSSASTYDDLDLLDGTDATGVWEVSLALGVDAVGGYREDYSDNCGLSRLKTGSVKKNVFVWQSDNTDCQNDESYTFAHELAHLAWADHSYAMWDSPPSYLRTLMGPTDDSLRLLRFSNPDHSFSPSGSPMGWGYLNDNNNASRIADKVVAELSSFRTYKAPAGGLYTPLEFPERIVDTRHGIGGYKSVQSYNEAREYPVLTNGVPAHARFVAVNLVLITTSGSGTLRVTDSRSKADSGSTLGVVRFKPGDVRAQTVVVTMSSYRTLWMKTTGGSVNVIADVIGYFSSSGSYLHPLEESARVFDTTVSANTDATVSVAAHCPTNTTAAAVNIVATQSSTSGYAVARGYYNAYDSTFSTLNYGANEAIANATFVEIDNRQFKIRPTTTARIVVDVFGCFTTTSSGGKQLTMYSSPVNRGTHTLSNTGHVDIAMGGGLNSVALTVADVTATNTNKTWLWAYKPTVGVPSTSNINLVPDDGISNMMVTPTAYSSSQIRIKRSTTTTGTVTVRVIQVGYFY